MTERRNQKTDLHLGGQQATFIRGKLRVVIGKVYVEHQLPPTDANYMTANRIPDHAGSAKTSTQKDLAEGRFSRIPARSAL
jgi:hypothetical protein